MAEKKDNGGEGEGRESDILDVALEEAKAMGWVGYSLCVGCCDLTDKGTDVDEEIKVLE